MKIPKRDLLANLPTPIEKHSFDGCSFLMKRDDFTGSEMTGNKVRKLEYLIHDAKQKKVRTIFTCGGDQSNHARATAFAAVKAGIKCKLFLWGKDKTVAEGNLFLDKLLGVEIKFLNKSDYSNVNEIMKVEAAKSKEKVYVIPSGGSSPLGIWGYINFVSELANQINPRNIKGILTAAGSGGTSAGLLLGSAFHGFNWKIYAVNVLQTKAEMEEEILRLASECSANYNLKVKPDSKNLVVLDGYSAEGYKKIIPEKLDLIKRFARSSGVVFDPVYTGKAFYAYHDKFLKDRKKSNILFVHTGGIFGVFEKRKEYLSS